MPGRDTDNHDTALGFDDVHDVKAIRLIARAGECKDRASLPPAHLRNDMCRGAKAVQADLSTSPAAENEVDQRLAGGGRRSLRPRPPPLAARA